MSNEQIKAALERIDAALRRIDAASDQKNPPPPSGALESLKVRHAALQSSTNSALRALDSLITSQSVR